MCVCILCILCSLLCLVQRSTCGLLRTTNESHGCRICFRFFSIDIIIRKSLNYKHMDISDV